MSLVVFSVWLVFVQHVFSQLGGERNQLYPCTACRNRGKFPPFLWPISNQTRHDATQLQPFQYDAIIHRYIYIYVLYIYVHIIYIYHMHIYIYITVILRP